MRTWILIPALMITMVACGSDKDDDKDESSSELDGTWSYACVDAGSGDSQSSDKRTLTFSDSSVKAKIESFVGHGCADKAFQVDVTGTFVAGEELTSPSGAKKLDTTVTGATMTLQDQTYVDSFNTDKMCGFSDWALDKAKTLTKEACAGGDFEGIFDPYFGIYKIDGGKLVEGKDSATNDGSTAAKRPTEFDTISATKS